MRNGTRAPPYQEQGRAPVSRERSNRDRLVNRGTGQVGEGSWRCLSPDLVESQAPDPSIFPSPQKHVGFTCRMRPERGSITRSFLSLHVVVRRLPSVLKDMQRITSEWQSIIFTGSPTSRFQMRTWESGHAGGGVSPLLLSWGICLQFPPDVPGRDALCRVEVCWDAGWCC